MSIIYNNKCKLFSIKIKAGKEFYKVKNTVIP